VKVFSYVYICLENFIDVFFCNQLFWTALGLNFALFEKQEFLRIRYSQVDIVFCQEYSLAFHLLESLENMVNSHLIANI